MIAKAPHRGFSKACFFPGSRESTFYEKGKLLSYMFLESFVLFSHKENSSCLGWILFWLKTCFTSEINFFPAMPFWIKNYFSSPKPPSEWKMKSLLRNRFLKMVTIFLEEINLRLWMLWFSRNFANFVILTKSWEISSWQGELELRRQT